MTHGRMQPLEALPEGVIATSAKALENLATPKRTWQRASGLEPSFRREIKTCRGDVSHENP